MANEAVGVQHSDLIDMSQSSMPSYASYLSVGLILGRFKRGSNKPMLINRNNIFARLGSDKSNPDFMAVLNALNEGVQEVWVMNVGATPIIVHLPLRITTQNKYRRLSDGRIRRIR